MPVTIGLQAGADLFSESTRAQISQVVRRACLHSPLPNSWNAGPVWGRELLINVRRLSSEQTGKQIYLDFLKSTYGYNISLLNAAYGVEAGSFTDLEGSLLLGADIKRSAVQRDDAEFLTALAKEFVTVTTAALRECNKNGVIYSESFHPDSTPSAVVE